MLRTTGRVTTLVLVAVLVLPACGGDDPSDALQSAFERTFDGSFAYELGIEADQDALGALGEGAGQAASFLAGFGLDGRVDGERSVLRVQALGLDAFELRVLSGEELYVRLGLRDLAAFAGVPLGRDQVVGALEGLNMPPAVIDAGVALVEDRWVGIKGAFPTERIRDLVGADQPEDDAAEQEINQAFGSDIPGFMDRFVTVSESREQDGQRRFEVALRLRDLLRTAGELNQRFAPATGGSLEDLEADLQNLPEEVPGSVDVRDGLVTNVRFDITGEDAAGAVALDLRLSRHGDVEAVTAPDDATIVPADDLATGLERLLALTGGVPPAG